MTTLRAQAMEPFAKVCPRCGSRYDAAASFCQRDGAPLGLLETEQDDRIGKVLLDQFRIEEKIGAGGMGSVYRARQTSLGRDVAIKILHADLASNADAVRRFQREARISTALDHPNVVRVFLFGQLPDGSLYLVMEHLRGRTLADLLRMERSLPVHRALHIVSQVADGVGEAHAQSIVHRDVKPENVFLVTKGRDTDFVKVLDFGIARLMRGEDTTSATQAGLVFGTARYISPEGAAGERTDVGSDVYSIGVMAYQLLCGETPFDGSTPVALLMKHIHEAPPHLKSRPGGAHVPDGVADVVMRALSKNPDGRYEDATELADVLRAVAQRAGLDVVRHHGGSSGIGVGERRDPTGKAIRELARQSHVPRTMALPERDSALPAAPPAQTSHSTPAPYAQSYGTGTESMSVPPGARRPRSVVGTVLLAFGIGAAAVASGAWVVHALTAPDPAVAEAEDLTRRAQVALAAGHLDGDDGVAALTDRILALRPGDAEATRLRHAAAARLSDDGARAESERRPADALALYRRARALAADDPRADAAIRRLEAPDEEPGRTAGIVVAPPPMAREPTVLTATVPSDVHFGPDDAPHFLVQRGRARVGAPEATPGSTPGTFLATYTFAAPGRYQVRFVAGSGETAYTLTADVDVARSPRGPAPTEGGEPIVTTIGAPPPQAPPGPQIIDVPPPEPVPVVRPRPHAVPVRPEDLPPPPPVIQPLPPAPLPQQQGTHHDPPPPPPWTSG